MKRDMDLIRGILLWIEKSRNPAGDIISDFSQYDELQVKYHIGLLYEANLITAITTQINESIHYLITGLTWSGHEFLEAARNNDIWNQAKEIIEKKDGGMVFDVVNKLLIKLLSEQVL